MRFVPDKVFQAALQGGAPNPYVFPSLLAPFSLSRSSQVTAKVVIETTDSPSQEAKPLFLFFSVSVWRL